MERLEYHNLIDTALNIVKEKNPQWYEYVKNIPFRINYRKKRTLGQARLGFCAETIISNTHIENGTREQLLNTLTHELAHHIAFKFYNDHGHGRMWRTVHRNLGGNGERCAKIEDGEHGYKRNCVKRIIIQREAGPEYKITLRRWNSQRVALLMNGYRHVRTETIGG